MTGRPSRRRSAPDPVTAPWLPDGVRLSAGLDLGGSGRSHVRRHHVLDGPAEWGSSVVVKRFLPQPEGRRAATGYVRERVGLSHLEGVPRLLAADDPSRTLVMEDVGADCPTLADVLLAERAAPGAHHRDPSVAAYRQTIAWAEALGRTAGSSVGVLAAARTELGGALAQDRRVRGEYPRAGLARLRETAGILHAQAATAEILDAVEGLERDTGRHVLGPGDACPDNAVLTPSGVRLIDLEGAGVRHLAYEAAYAAEPFSTCWCVLTPPPGLPDAMLAAFTDAAQTHLPGLAEDPRWARQVRVAVAAWVLSGTLWLLDGAVADRGLAPTGREGPRLRALLVARWRWVVRECGEDLPDVATACDEAVTWAGRSWRQGSALVLPPYPAFTRPAPRPATVGRPVGSV